MLKLIQNAFQVTLFTLVFSLIVFYINILDDCGFIILFALNSLKILSDILVCVANTLKKLCW
jgi:hypothetical protein